MEQRYEYEEHIIVNATYNPWCYCYESQGAPICSQ